MERKGLLATGLLVCLFLLITGVTWLQADVYMKQKTHTDGFTVMGQTQPAKDEITVIWIGKDRSRTDTGEKSSLIVRADKGVVYRINHQKLTYRETPLNLKQMVDKNVAGQDKDVQEFAELAEDMAEAFAEGTEVKVTETQETKTIGKWDCRKYLINTSMPMGETSSEAWATDKLKMDWKNYLMLTNAMMAGSSGFEKMIDKMYKEMSKIKGVVVYQLNKTTAMDIGINSTTEMLEFEEKTPPEGLYDVPAGYKAEKNPGGRR
jgi:hypothetical protein